MLIDNVLDPVLKRRSDPERLDHALMRRLAALASMGAEVKVECASYGNLETISGKLRMVIAFNKIRIASDDEFGEAGRLIPFIGKGTAIRKIIAGKALVYDNTARVSEKYNERDPSQIQDLIKESFIQEGVLSLEVVASKRA